jgi:predicted ATPase
MEEGIPLRIGFTGVHGTGKTTLLREMIGWPELAGHAFLTGLTRLQSKQNGLAINEHGDFNTQLCLVKALNWHVKTLPNLVVDRTLLDIYSYTVFHKNQGKLTGSQLNKVRTIARHQQHAFDVVFYIRPEFEVLGDGIRSDDKDFAWAMATIFERVVNEDKIGTRKIVLLTGTVEERLQQIRKEILNDQQQDPSPAIRRHGLVNRSRLGEAKQ